MTATELLAATDGASPGASEAPGGAFPGWTPGFGVALDRLHLAVRRPVRSAEAGALRSTARGRGLEFAAHRPYVPGDDPRLIDWRAYGRLDRVFLRQLEEERTRRVTVLVDASASMDFGAGGAHKGRFARRLAAALAWICLGRGEPVRTLLLREGSATALPRVASRQGAGALFARLSGAEEPGRSAPEPGARAELGGPDDPGKASGLAGAVRRALALAGPAPGAGGAVVLLSDLLDPTWPEALAALGAAGEGAVVQTLAPAEWSPELADEVELEDAETGELRPARLDPAELDAYARRLASFLEGVREGCRRHNLLHAALDSGAGLQDAVFRRLTAARLLE